MPWAEDVVNQVMTKCCMFMPFQKAIGGISGYFVVSLTPPAFDLIEANQKDPAWAIPRQLKMVVPVDPKMPLERRKNREARTVFTIRLKTRCWAALSTLIRRLAFAETTFGLLRTEKRIGSVMDANKRSTKNRDASQRLDCK